MKKQLVLGFTTLITLGSGLINLLSVINPSLPERTELLRDLFPLEFLHISRFLTLLIGFALVISSINIFRKKKRAFQMALFLAILSVVFHLIKGLDYEEASISLALAVLLVLGRKQFRVKSSLPNLKLGVVRALLALLVVINYGVLGFWLLEKHHFGQDFTFSVAIKKTFQVLTFSGQSGLRPLTRYGQWFLDSLELMTVIGIIYILYAFFRPVLYLFRILPHERALASEILKAQGRSSLDFFKTWPDKSFLFSPSQKSFLAYRVGGNFGIALADPVGPVEEIPQIILSFRDLCEGNDWHCVFHQVLPDFLPAYQDSGFKKLKIGEEAIVSLAEFALDGKRMKHLRHYMNQLEKTGLSAQLVESPVPDDVLAQVEEVSRAWLAISGRKERGFTQGTFKSSYVRRFPLFIVRDEAGRIFAFANVIPSFAPGESTVDLMRHREDAPPGIMDYLFIKLFALQKEKGFTRFSLGMAPMSGFREDEEVTAEERAVHNFLRRLDFLFSYQGLFHFKKKFATSWEPRYVIYRNVLELPRLALALNRVSAVHDQSDEY